MEVQLIEEEWRDIHGYENLYKVSNLGRVRSLDRIILKGNGHLNSCETLYAGKILSQQLGNGYLHVNLCDRDHKSKVLKVHRLVAIAFIPNPERKLYVNHIDNIRTNNNYNNLEWCTTSENGKHAVKVGVLKTGKGENANRAKINWETVNDIRTSFCNKTKTVTELSKLYEISESQVRRIIKFQRWKV